MKPYKGITPLSGGSLASCAEAYFAQSEQLPTRFKLSFGKSTEADRREHWRAGGIMVQHMPKSSIEVSGEGGSGEDGLMVASDLLTGNDHDDWNRVNILLDTVEDIELTGPVLEPKNLLIRLFHEEVPRAFEPQSVEFGCTCSEERVRQSLSIYSAKDIEKMTTPEGTVTADCQFCGAHYDLSPETVGIQANKNGKP
jgi:molecular chaperone Hsp33